MNKKSGFAEAEQKYTKFSISLSEDTELFLDDLKQKIRTRSGVRMSRSEVIRAAIRYVKRLEPDLTKVKDEDDLIAALVAAGKKLSAK